MSQPNLEGLDLEKLVADIRRVASEAPLALAEYRAASVSLIHDLCVLLGAGSYKAGREKLIEFLLRNPG